MKKLQEESNHYCSTITTTTHYSKFMDDHTCKVCSRRFLNGRALGGHMRSHIMPSSSSSSSSSGKDQEEEETERRELTQVGRNGGAMGVGYGLRENPRKSFRLVDPEFKNLSNFACSAVVFDGESETESCKRPVVVNNGSSASRRELKRKWRRQSPVRSISETTTATDEDVAFCLVMLSRDSWTNTQKVKSDEEDEDDDGKRVVSTVGSKKGTTKYRCGTCKKVFKSYQALGGHRANHRKLKPLPPPTTAIRAEAEAEATMCVDVGDHGNHFDWYHSCNAADSKTASIHECPVCFKVFASPQALGGHKRAHPISPPPPPQIPPTGRLIDLNLPAPVEDSEMGNMLVEVSAVSFVRLITTNLTKPVRNTLNHLLFE